MTKHYVYILRSLSDQRFYVGLTNKLPGRVEAHNAGLVMSTRKRAPLELIYWEGCLNRSDAAQREKYLKSAPILEGETQESQDRVGKALFEDTVATLSHGVNPFPQQASSRPDGRRRNQRLPQPSRD